MRPLPRRALRSQRDPARPSAGPLPVTFVLVLKPRRAAGLSLLEARSDIRVIRPDAPTEAVNAAHLPEAHALRMKNTALLAEAQHLRVVSKHGVGLDNLPMEALTSRGIPVAWIGGANARAVAEHAMLLMLALARRLPQYQARSRAGGYIDDPDWPTFDLRGRRLLPGLDFGLDLGKFWDWVEAFPHMRPESPGVRRTRSIFPQPEQVLELIEQTLRAGRSDADVRGVLGETSARVCEAE